MMCSLFLPAYSKLIGFHSLVARNDFNAIHERVRACPVTKQATRNHSIQEICSAVDLACIWYWKEVLCLQRSAATVCLLRRCGIPALLAIGGQPIPFKAHAWVEVDGRVVNDKPYVNEIYSVLDRC